MNAATPLAVCIPDFTNAMKTLRLLPFLPALTAGLLFAAPAMSLAGNNKIVVYRDNDGDGHYNKQTFTVNNNCYRGGYYGGGFYGGGYGAFFRPGYYRPNPYYQPYYYAAPSFGVTFGRSVYSAPRPSYSSYSDALAVDVQRALSRRGYYRGAIDGDVGPGTRAAIRGYQIDRGLPVTGRIDRPLLRSLGVS